MNKIVKFFNQSEHFFTKKFKQNINNLSLKIKINEKKMC